MVVPQKGPEGRRGFGRGNRRNEESKEEEWVPVTRLGRLVKSGQIRSIDEIYRMAASIKEYQIIDRLVPSLSDEVMKIMSVQKQTGAGQRTRFKAFVVIGDRKCHVGFGVKCSKEVATAIRGAIVLAKLSLIPVRLFYWGGIILGDPHTVPALVSGKCGSVRVKLIPAPKGTGIVAADVPKKILELAGVQDCYTSTRGTTRTLENFAKATFYAIEKAYTFRTPSSWLDRDPSDRCLTREDAERLEKAYGKKITS